MRLTPIINIKGDLKMLYICLVLTVFLFIREIIGPIRQKNYRRFFEIFPFFLFFFAFFISCILGGSAFNDASTNYELYQDGCYYLKSHGSYTEVSFACYIFAIICEITAFSSLIVGAVMQLVSFKLKKRRNKAGSHKEV